MNIRLKISNVDRVIFFLFACWLLVDMLNGYLLNAGATFSVSQIYKALVTVIVIVRCIDNKPILKLVCCMIIYLSIYSINLILVDEEVGSSLILLSKFLTSILLFVYFIQINNVNRDYFLRKAKFVIAISFCVFTANMALGALGYGFNSYGSGIGSRGFFFSLNELSGVLAVLFPWIFYYCKRNLPTCLYYVCCASLFLLSFTLSTKSGIVATVMFFFLINYFYGGKIDKIVMIFLFASIILMGFVYFQMVLSAGIPVIERFSYFIDQQGFIDALTSNRLHYWEESGKEFYRSGLSVWILGLGGQRTVEMDPYDALLNCGIVGLIFLIWLYWMMLFYPLMKKYSSLSYSKVIFSSNLLLVIISIGGGHILFSSMAGMLIALSNAILFGEINIFNSKQLLKSVLLKKILLNYKL